MIEDIILRHSQRGMDVLRPYMPKAFCEEAVEALLNLPHGVIFLTTGFYVAGYAETDGPLGTEVLAQALKKLGYQPVIVTDALCKDYFEPMRLEVEYVPFDADASFYQDLLLKRDPVGLISIERCGINSKNDYANMRGVSIRENTATIDQLFSLAHKKGLPTWGVGDGGNEIGMGNLKDVISKKLSLVPCVNKVDHLVIATVSNWGAFGMTAYLEKLTGVHVFPSYENMHKYLEQTVAIGSIDGVNKVHVCTVDGYPAEIEEEIVNALQDSLSN